MNYLLQVAAQPPAQHRTDLVIEAKEGEVPPDRIFVSWTPVPAASAPYIQVSASYRRRELGDGLRYFRETYLPRPADTSSWPIQFDLANTGHLAVSHGVGVVQADIYGLMGGGRRFMDHISPRRQARQAGAAAAEIGVLVMAMPAGSSLSRYDDGTWECRRPDGTAIGAHATVHGALASLAEFEAKRGAQG